MQSLEKTELSIKKHFLVVQFFVGIVLVLGFALIFSLRNVNSLQNIVILFGEKIKIGPLDHNYWHEVLGNLRFTVLVSILFLDGFLTFILFRDEIEQSSKLQNAVSVVTVLFSAIFTLAILDGGNGWGGDFSEYIAQARAIVTGTVRQQVENSNFPYENPQGAL